MLPGTGDTGERAPRLQADRYGEIVCDLMLLQGANSDELDMLENEELEVVESEGDGWMRVCTLILLY